MRTATLIVKTAWKLRRDTAALARAAYFRAFPGSYFKSLGERTRVFGMPGFGNVAGNITFGANGMIGERVFFSASDEAEIIFGDHCSINTGSHIVAAYGIRVGDGTRIGEYVTLRDQNHEFEDPTRPIALQGFRGAPIRIGADVWIGRGVMVGPGVNVGDGAVIGANSVVTRDIPAGAVAVGTPARVTRMRGDRIRQEQGR